jgi:hypothetical protein
VSPFVHLTGSPDSFYNFSQKEFPDAFVGSTPNRVHRTD